MTGSGSASGPRRRLTEQVISLTSLPMAAQCPARTSLSSSHCSVLSVSAFHCWAQRATARSVRRLPRPPIVTGGCGRCTGFGSHLASVSLTYWPVNVVTGWLSRLTMASTPSSNRSNRSRSGGRSMP
jgi:hypothetical protein